jgi:hypothetical protein
MLPNELVWSYSSATIQLVHLFLAKVYIMRRIVITALLGLALSSSVGCFIPAYDADPAVRARQLIYTSEDLRNLREEWHRFWFLDQPDHMNPIRTHGGIL